MISLTNNYKLSLPLMLLVGIAACKKDNATPKPEIAINLTKPQPNTVFAKGDTVWIAATVNSPVDLHGFEWQAISTADNLVLASEEQHTHGKTLSVNSYWVNTLADSATVQLVLTAEIDHEGNTSSKTVEIQCIP